MHFISFYVCCWSVLATTTATTQVKKRQLTRGLYSPVAPPSQKNGNNQLVRTCYLERKAWINLNRIRTGVGRTKHFLYKIGAASSPERDCGKPQTMNHIINDCEIYKSPRGIPGLLDLDDETGDETISWLKTDLPLWFFFFWIYTNERTNERVRTAS